MTHANLCRPLHYFVVAHTTKPLSLSYSQIKELINLLKKDGFRVVSGDDTGLIVSSGLETENLPEELKQIVSPSFFPSCLDIFIAKEGLILISLFGGVYFL